MADELNSVARARLSLPDDDIERAALARECNEKEAAFVREYVIDQNGLQSVLRAGCFNVSTNESAGVAAVRLLARPRVQALLAISIAQRAQRTNLTSDSVLYEMSLLAQSDHSHYVIGDDGKIELTADAPEGAMRAIKKVKRKKTITEDKDGTINIVHDVEIELWDKPGSLKLMGRNVGLFPDKLELSGPGGKPLVAVTRIERVLVVNNNGEPRQLPPGETNETS